ncbi:MAG: hypothetical protein AAFR74_09175 [Pseudomonadota bacterium]
MLGQINIRKAEVDMRPKTDFLRIEGSVFTESYTAKVEVSLAQSPPLNERILLLELKVTDDDGPKKIQPTPFYFSTDLLGSEPWTHVQIVGEHSDDVSPITVICFREQFLSG